MTSNSIDSLFGSKTRVKLLGLFFNNPGKSFYVREITRLIDEQVNSVRRELSNLRDIDIVESTTKDRKLYYKVNQRHKLYIPLKAMFTGSEIKSEAISESVSTTEERWTLGSQKIKKQLTALIVSGILVSDSNSTTDVLLVGDNTKNKLSNWAAKMEDEEGRDLNYTVMSPEEFRYRLSVRDRFIAEILEANHLVIVDTNKLLKTEGEEDV